jgi:hypothetical protein
MIWLPSLEVSVLLMPLHQQSLRTQQPQQQSLIRRRIPLPSWTPPLWMQLVRAFDWLLLCLTAPKTMFLMSISLRGWHTNSKPLTICHTHGCAGPPQPTEPEDANDAGEQQRWWRSYFVPAGRLGSKAADCQPVSGHALLKHKVATCFPTQHEFLMCCPDLAVAYDQGDGLRSVLEAVGLELTSSAAVSVLR